MRRLHLLEIEDQPWCPAFIRDAATDFLQFTIELFNPYGIILPRLKQALKHSGAEEIIDLCSGGGGPWLSLGRELEREGLRIRLTDKFPNLPAFQRLEEASEGIGYCSHPVDATAMPAELEGFRTIFSSFHHFRPEEARAILEDAVISGQGLGIFEAVQRKPRVIFLALFTPLMVLALTPFIRPFRWSRLLWTYLIPVVPFVVGVDGIVSCLRAYTIGELQELTQGLSAYAWEIGEERRGRFPVPITYLIGYPQKQAVGS